MRVLKSVLTVAVALFLLGVAKSAFADSITFTLLNPTETIGAGQTVTFNATVTATAGNAKNIYLNSDSSNITDKGSVFILDDSDFLANFPFFLTPTGASDTHTGAIFTVTNTGNIAETYSGTFTLFGGANSSASKELATADFGSPAITATPEPSSWLLMATGLGAMVVLVRRRQALGLFAGGSVKTCQAHTA